MIILFATITVFFVSMLTVIVTSRVTIRRMRGALQRIILDKGDHACLQRNTAAGVLTWARDIAAAALEGRPAPKALSGPMRLNFPAHCEHLADALLELADHKVVPTLRGDGPAWMRVLLDVTMPDAWTPFKAQQAIREVLGMPLDTLGELEVAVIGVELVAKSSPEELKINLNGMAATLLDAAATALLDQAYGGPARRVPVARIKTMVKKADELRIRAQSLD